MKHRESKLAFLFLSFFVFIVISCNNRKLSVPDYIQYVRSEENGLLNKLIKGGYIFSALYEPSEYVAIKELRNEKITKESYASTLPKFSDYIYFDFSIRPENTSQKILDPADSVSYDKKFNHFSFNFSKDIFLISKEDTLSCLLHQFISSNGVSPEYHFELLFEKPNSSFISRESLIFLYDDKTLNSGKVMIPILTKDIKNIPQLKI